MSRVGEFRRKRERNLLCSECGRVQTHDERGWKAFLTTDEDEPEEAVVYCPSCAAREFGPDARPTRVDLLDGQRERAAERLEDYLNRSVSA